MMGIVVGRKIPAPRWKTLPLRVKVFRWLRYRPWYFLRFLARFYFWVNNMCPVDVFWPTRRKMLRHLWVVQLALCQHKMGNYLTTKEYMAEIQERIMSDEGV